jgi:hypothetical protein
VNDYYGEKLKELNNQINKNLEDINGEMNDLDKNRFKNMKKICDEYEVKNNKICNKIVNLHIKELINEAKEYVKGVRDEIKNIRDKINKLKISKKLINENIGNLSDSEQYKKFKLSSYYVLANECRKDIRTVKELEEQLKIDNIIIDLNKEIETIDSSIHELEDMSKIRIEGAKKSVLLINKFFKYYDLNENEQMLIKKIIQELKSKLSDEKKDINSMISIEKENARSKKSKLRKMKKKYTRKLIKAFKVQNKEFKKEDKILLKEERAMIKEARKTENINEEFKHKILSDLVEKHNNAANIDVKDAIISAEKELADKEDAKLKAKNDKEDAKLKAKNDNEAAKLKAKNDKEAAKLERITIKNNEKEAKKLARKTAKNK